MSSSVISSYYVTSHHHRKWPIEIEFHGAVSSKNAKDRETLLLIRVQLPGHIDHEGSSTVINDQAQWKITADEHFIYSIGQLKLLIGTDERYQQMKPFKDQISRLELITPPRNARGRFGAISAYLVYLEDQIDQPAFYLLQGNDAWGTKARMYIPNLFEPGENELLPFEKQFIHNVVGFPFTPMSHAKNVYRAMLKMRKSNPNEPLHVTVHGYLPHIYELGQFDCPENRYKIESGQAKPYITIRMGFHGIADSQELKHDPLTCLAEAANRAGAIELAIGNHCKSEGYDPSAKKRVSLTKSQFEIPDQFLWNINILTAPVGLTYLWDRMPKNKMPFRPYRRYDTRKDLIEEDIIILKDDQEDVS